MQRDLKLEAVVVAKYAAVAPVLDERSRRVWAAAESLAIGDGGGAIVSAATGLARVTVRKGRRELARGGPPVGRIRRPGAGRPNLRWQADCRDALEALVDPLTRGDPTSPLRWTCKSRAKREGTAHPDRNAQFEHINATADRFLQRQQPVISVDTKKKELVGNFKNGGREWQPKGAPEAVRVHDFPADSCGKAIPYGVYDMGRNEAWVSVGHDHDTPAFAVASIRH